MAGTNGGFSPEEEPASSVRIYGDVRPEGNAPTLYNHWKEPFDPTIIPKDSITYNPAIIEECREAGEPYYGIIIGKGSSSENAREKIFARTWYEPCGEYNGPRKNDTHPTINMEFTYMLMNTLYLPIVGTAPNTEFLVPTCEIDTQAGLGAWSRGAVDKNLTSLASVSGDVSPYGKTVKGRISLEKRLALLEGDKVQFFDHTVELTNIKETGEFVIKVAYAGNAQDDSEKGWISLKNDGKKIYFDRHNNEYPAANHNPAAGHIRTWYVSRDGDTLIVGKELHWGDVFFVDGVRYEVTAIEVLDINGNTEADAFKYLTLRTKLPKCVGAVRDESVVSSQFIDCIEPAELIPMLPPFNMKHDMVDDIDIPLWTDATEERDWTRQDYAGTELDTDGDGNWIAYDVNERVIDNIDPLEVIYIEEQEEQRYSTNLLEKLREDWVGEGQKDLYLVVDSSQNLVDDGYFDLQIEGLASAIYAIPQDGTVSVCVIQFSDFAKVEVPLTTITPDNANWVSAQIRGIVPIERNTNMSTAFYKVAKVINETSNAPTIILDISSDGWVTEGDTMAARAAALAEGLGVINVFGIGESSDTINTVFLQSLVTPTGFYIFATDSGIIVDKTEEKIRQEVGGLITESWTKFDIQSLPDQYTEFVLPALPDYYTLPDVTWPVELDGDYLITTSWIAPQATGDLYDHKRGGDQTEQRVAFSYDPKDGEDGNDIYVYYDNELKMGTVKIYGNGSASTWGVTNACNIEQYENWEEPFNPTAIRKDSITFDTAILRYSPEYSMNAQNENVDLKEYLRAWYVPEYEFFGWHEMIGLAPAIVIETTYMLIDSQDKKPWHADVGSWFPFPIRSDPTSEQMGLDSFENPGVDSIRKNLVRLASLSCNAPDIAHGLPKTTNGTIRIEKTYIMEAGDVVQFIDHRLEFTGYGISDTSPSVTISYCGNPEEYSEVGEPGIHLTNVETFFDRHNKGQPGNVPKHPDVTWYARYDGRLKDTSKAMITVGKELQRGDVFHVDGVRYEIPAIEVLDNNGTRDDGCEKFKYITLRTPLPKYLGGDDYLGQQYLSCADSQWLKKVHICHPLPVLPPLNMDHELVDDTDVVLWQPLKLLDKWPYGDVETGKAGTEYFPCAERYLTMQYPPYAWLRYFRAVPIDTDGDMGTRIPSDWQLWDDYNGPFYPGDVTVAMPNGWKCCKCGIQMLLPSRFTVFDTEHWIANDVDERIIGPVEPLKFCWKQEDIEPRYSTNLLEILNETLYMDAPADEDWTKFDIRTIPDEYTRFKLPEVPSLNPVVYVGGEYQLSFEPDIRFDMLSKAQPGCYIITTSFFAPNAKGDLNRGQSYPAKHPAWCGTELCITASNTRQ
jgi:uncharacterized Zn finger protein